MDETYALPTEKAVKIALRTQQLIAHEIGVKDVIDPLGGSYYVEYLTNKMEREAEEYFKKIEALGGVLKCIEKGFFQREIAQAAYRYQKEIEEKKRIIVGVNEYVEDTEPDIEILRIPPEVEKKQIERLRQLRKERNSARVKETLRDLRQAASDGENVMPFILNCVRAYCTIGEITDALREVFGEYRETPIF